MCGHDLQSQNDVPDIKTVSSFVLLTSKAVFSRRPNLWADLIPTPFLKELVPCPLRHLRGTLWLDYGMDTCTGKVLGRITDVHKFAMPGSVPVSSERSGHDGTFLAERFSYFDSGTAANPNGDNHKSP